jgi:fibronectin type 3 domain-containing protein
VWLLWKSNADHDLSGYRLYRSNRPEFEFQLVAPAVISDTFFVDSVNLYTLTHEVYYRLRAIDLRQNQSAFSDILELTRPDVIPPVAPVIVEVVEQKTALVVAWLNSSSNDMAFHHIYRKEKSDTALQLIARVERQGYDKRSSYADVSVEAGKTYVYQISAEDQSGLLSPLSAPVQQKSSAGIAEAIRLKKREQGGITMLTWEVKSTKKVARVLIYKALGSAPMRLLGSTSETSFIDSEASVEQTERYRAKVVYEDGTSSALSNEVVVK